MENMTKITGYFSYAAYFELEDRKYHCDKWKLLEGRDIKAARIFIPAYPLTIIIPWNAGN